MPISPAYSWSETDATVLVTAQCKGISASTTDIYCSPHYVSVNSAPYFLELDLCGQIDASASVGTVRKGEVSLKLIKTHSGTPWGRLLVDLPRLERLKRREASKAALAAEAEANLERKKKKVWDDSRHTLTKQMDLDREDRMRIERLKEEEHAAEAAELEAFEASTGQFEAQLAAEGKKGGKAGGRTALAAPPKPPKPPVAGGQQRAAIQELVGDVFSGDDAPPLVEGSDALAAQQSADIFDEEDVVPATGESLPPPPPKPPPSAATSAVAPPTAKAAAKAQAPLPPPRGGTKVTIKFTKQLLSAPARTKDERLANSDLPDDPIEAPGLRTVVKGDLDISQRDPAWLKDRGDRKPPPARASEPIGEQTEGIARRPHRRPAGIERATKRRARPAARSWPARSAHTEP